MFNRLFGNAKARGGEIARALSKKDDLERAATVALGAVWADGEAEDKEIDAAHNIIKGIFGDTFRPAEIDGALEKADSMFKNGRFTAKRKLKQACEEVESEHERSALMALACDVCASSGGGDGLGDDERKWLGETLAPALRVKLADYI